MRLDHEPIDPEIAASLDAIDAVLAGEPVDARYVDLAEIALLVTAERPQVRPSFAQSMDQRVARRFAAVPSERPRRRRLSPGFWEASGALAAGLALIVGLVVLVGGHHGASSASSSSSAAASSAAATTASSGSAGSSARPASGAKSPAQAPAAAGTRAPAAAGTRAPAAAGTRAPAAAGTRAPAAAGTRAPAAAGTRAPAAAGTRAPAAAGTPAPPTVQPPTSGRKVVQSAELNLAAAPNRIDDVAQQVYDVIGGLGGIVDSSTVTQTGGPGGYAQFQLSIPSASLGQAMSRLSSLNYATVLSRTDSSQDVTDQYGAAQRALADARALRTSLLKHLADATTTEQVNSLKAQIRDAEASISSDQATLNRLNHAVGFSRLALEVSARSVPAPVSHGGGGGFGIGRAAHDAGRVLTVAAGVALIALAALTPVALVAALAWWVGAAFRRRHREQALDST